jgi:hypothetical protein
MYKSIVNDLMILNGLMCSDEGPFYVKVPPTISTEKLVLEMNKTIITDAMDLQVLSEASSSSSPWLLMWTRSPKMRGMITQLFRKMVGDGPSEDENSSDEDEEEVVAESSIPSEWIIYEWVRGSDEIKIFTPYNYKEFFAMCEKLPPTIITDGGSSNIGLEIKYPITNKAIDLLQDRCLDACESDHYPVVKDYDICKIPAVYMKSYSNDWNIELLDEIKANHTDNDEGFYIDGIPLFQNLIFQPLGEGDKVRFYFSAVVEDGSLMHVRLHTQLCLAD